MKTVTAILVGMLGVFSTSAAAIATAHHPPGALLTHGGTAPHTYTLAPLGNPAAASLTTHTLRLGVLSSAGAALELGKTGNFARRLDTLKRRFDTLSARVDALIDTGAAGADDSTDTLIRGLRVLERDGNAALAELGKHGYAKLHLGATAPLAPAIFRSGNTGGAFTLYAHAYAEGRLAVSASGETFRFGLDGIEDHTDIALDEERRKLVNLNTGEDIDPEFDDRAGLSVQGGIIHRLSGGYAHHLFHAADGSLHAGIMLNLYRVTLTRSGRLLREEGTVRTARRAFRKNRRTSSGAGIDLGLLWVGGQINAGLSLHNVNEPSFTYPDVCRTHTPAACAFYAANPRAARNGNAWTMERQWRADASVRSRDNRWRMHARLDANAVRDTTGDAYRWLAISASYEPGSLWVPAPRLGYRRNLVGQQLHYLSVGITVFRGFHLDISRSLETTTHDGRRVPRALQFNVGVDLQF